MNSKKQIPLLFLWTAMLGGHLVHSYAITEIRALQQDKELKLDPSEAMAFSGDNVTFTCSYPTNVTFNWDFMSKVGPIRVVSGTNGTTDPIYYSKATLGSVTRVMSGEVRCSLDGDQGTTAMAILIVSGVRNGGACHSSTDCITDRAICQKGFCSCPKHHVLIRLTESGYEVCREMIYSLYEPCEFNEQCSHLVDAKSICSSNSVCTCAPWAIDINGRCVSRSEITYTKNQEMYRVGLIAVTCVIILVVAISLWITLRRSCREQNMSDRRSFHPPGPDDYPNAMIMEGVDKPPSYEDAQETVAVINSPPNFKDALTNCMTAKKLLRQVSAPAGQLLAERVSQNPSADGKTGCVSKVFSPDV